MTTPETTPPAPLEENRAQIHRHMLSPVAHDLKTPLASIIGSLEVYERMHAQLPSDKKEALIRVALQEAHRLEGFITNILDMVKFESGLVQPQREETALATIVDICVSRLERRLSHCAVHVDPAPATIKIITDSSLLVRAMTLILDNACRYSGDKPTIDLRFGKEGKQGFVEIRDHGKGIPDEQHEAIFEKYARQGSQDSQGLGLGLAICREIMKLLGGSVTASTHPEGGAVFMLKFPLD